MTKRFFATSLMLSLSVALQVEAQSRLGVLPPVVEGELNVAAASGFEAALLENIPGDDAEFITSTELARQAGTSIEQLSSCTTAECIRRIASGAGIDGVVRLSIQASLNMYSMQIEVTGADGQRIARIEENCDLCTLSEARETLGQAAAGLELDLPRVGVVRLVITPPSALVTIDGDSVSGTEIELAPGSHHAVIAAEGYVSQERSLQIRTGDEVNLSITLERESGTSPPDVVRPPREGLGALGISGVVLTAAGGLALAAGIALIVIDGNCAGGRTDANGQCELIYSSLGGGAALAAIGGVSLVTGIILIVIDRLRSRDSSSTERRGSFSPVLGIGFDGTPQVGGSWHIDF